VKIPNVVLPIFFDKPVKLWPSLEQSSASSLTLETENWYQIESDFEHDWHAFGDDDVWPAPIFEYEQPSLVSVDSYCDASFKSCFPTSSNNCNEAYLQSCQIRWVYFWPCEIRF